MQVPSTETSLEKLPAGRLLYKQVERPRHVVVRSPRWGLWVVDDEWTPASRAAGPFRTEDVLRAVRLANTVVPQGCELGPWQGGMGLFERRSLPGQADEWSTMDPAWLEPSVTLYSDADFDRVANEACCGAPRDTPRPDGSLDAAVEREVRGLLARREPAFLPATAGALTREWNAHPRGSPILAERSSLIGAFVVVDLPG